MNSIMHIAYNAGSAARRTVSNARGPRMIRLLYTVNNTEIHLLNGVTRKLHVVHVSEHAEQVLEAQKKVNEAVRVYMARIHKRVPPDNIA